MHTDELLESCLQALSSGQEIPPDIARYLARHLEQRTEVEELLFIAQRAARLQPAEIDPARRRRIERRLAARIGVDPVVFISKSARSDDIVHGEPGEHQARTTHSTLRRRLLATGRASLARLRYPTTNPADEAATARIRTAFRDLSPEDIRHYIGVRGEQYLYYRQRFPRWELVFALLAALLRGFKHLEKLTNLN